MWTPTRELLNDLLERGVGTSTTTVLGNASIGLCRAPVAPTVNTVLADLTEANYDGYARQAAALVTPAYIGPGTLSILQGGTLEFASDDTTTVNTIYAQFLVKRDGTTLYAVEAFDTPVNLPTPDYRLTIVERFGLTPGTTYGSSLVST